MTGDPLRRLSPVIRLAPAKINLTLVIDVGGPGLDGAEHGRRPVR